MRFAVFFLTVVLLLFSCATTADPMAEWKGVPVNELIAATRDRVGGVMPSLDSLQPNGRRVVEYTQEQTGGGQIQVPPSPTSQYQGCTLRIDVDEAGRITSWEWINRDALCHDLPPSRR